MSARAGHAQGWVTVADAAAALSASGDPIDASNVSRYLARFPDVPSEKVGKFRFVDLEALTAHRAENVLVVEKRTAREIPEAESAPARRAAVEDAEPEARQPSAINAANLKLKNLQVRERELDIAEREGALIPAPEVLALIAGVTDTLIAELERQETAIVARHGREVGAAVRVARKAAQSAAAAKLIELAIKSMPPALAAKIAGGSGNQSAA